MIKDNMLASIVILFLLLPIAFLGCSGGGGSDGATVSRETDSVQIQVLPSEYDFGIVTPGNSPAPLEVEIINNGSGVLSVSEIALSDTDNFSLDFSGGSNSCNTASPTINAGGSCTVEVAFQPTLNALFDATLTIRSNDPNTPTIDVPLSGSQEAVSELNVRINQVETSCPSPVATAYVSVTDQGGYPVTGLTKDDFSVTENATPIGPPTSVSFVSDTATISVALVMDYSGSITDVQDNIDDMEESAAYFVNQLGADDEAEIIKFATEIAVVQSFSSDKNLLTTAIYDSLDVGRDTALYDAVIKAVDDTALRLNNRRAVILISDGVDDDGSGNQLSNNDLSDAINYANNNGVPIFAVALGQFYADILHQMADNTGGQVYEATTSDNLRTIYQQLADVLFQKQYILTYTSSLGAGVTADLTIEATLQAIVGNDTREITSCP